MVLCIQVECSKIVLYELMECSNLKQMNFPKMNTFFLFETDEMFSGCKEMENLDLSNLITASVKDMTRMFFGCSSLKSLDIIKFNTRSLKNYDDIFGEIDNITNIKYNEDKTEQISNQIKEILNKNKTD